MVEQDLNMGLHGSKFILLVIMLEGFTREQNEKEFHQLIVCPWTIIFFYFCCICYSLVWETNNFFKIL